MTCWSASATETSGRSYRRGCSTRASTSLTPTSPWLWVARSGSVSTCSEWVGCCGRARASVPRCMSLLRGIPSKSVKRAGDARALLSADLLSYSVAGTLAVPHFLGEHDHPWLRVLLEEHQRFIGRPQRELEARLAPVWGVELALRGNPAVVGGMLFRATVVRMEVEGNTRVRVRHAKWRGLICTLARRSGEANAMVELSGPFALFRNTRL